jgi:hypothetical protein
MQHNKDTHYPIGLLKNDFVTVKIDFLADFETIVALNEAFLKAIL